MKLSVNKRLDEIVKCYFPNSQKYRLIKELSNNEFLIRTEKGQFVAKEYAPTLSKDRLLFFEWLQNSTNAQMGISPQVVKTRDGNLNVNIGGLNYDLTEFVECKRFRRENVQNRSKFFYEIGSFVGKLHKTFSEIESAGQNIMRSQLYIPPESPSHMIRLLKSYKKARIEENWAEIVKVKIDIVNSYPNGLNQFNKLPKKIVHGDLYMKNILFNKSQKVIGLIDFVQAGMFFRCYEVVRALIQINRFFQNIDINPKHITSYMRGYLQYTYLDEDEVLNMLDFYIYVQASDTSFLDIKTILDGGRENNEYAKYRFNSLQLLYKNRHLLCKAICNAK